MITKLLKCPNCGGKRFKAKQRCHGVIDVIVDGKGEYLENVDIGYIDTGDLEFADSEAPFLCESCNVEAVEDETDGHEADA